MMFGIHIHSCYLGFGVGYKSLKSCSAFTFIHPGRPWSHVFEARNHLFWLQMIARDFKMFLVVVVSMETFTNYSFQIARRLLSRAYIYETIQSWVLSWKTWKSWGRHPLNMPLITWMLRLQQGRFQVGTIFVQLSMIAIPFSLVYQCDWMFWIHSHGKAITEESCCVEFFFSVTYAKPTSLNMASWPPIVHNNAYWPISNMLCFLPNLSSVPFQSTLHLSQLL